MDRLAFATTEYLKIPTEDLTKMTVICKLTLKSTIFVTNGINLNRLLVVAGMEIATKLVIMKQIMIRSIIITIIAIVTATIKIFA